ncbi:MAG: hypothetical protein IPG51_17460 [Chloroflexi bacterium]|nr:hypothetical protein [Chloroflexota bacterium]
MHFAYLWQRSSFVERALLTAVAHLMDAEMMFRADDLIQYLETYGIELTAVEVTTALNSLVEREILAETPVGVTTQYELKIGLVGLWVAQHKSLSKLHAEKDADRAKKQNGRHRLTPHNSFGSQSDCNFPTVSGVRSRQRSMVNWI